MVGEKLNKPVRVPERINLSEYLSSACNNQKLTYRLASVVIHEGTSQTRGHYTAIGRADTGTYYRYDDRTVQKLSVETALKGSKDAYIIFYELKTSSANSTRDKVR